MTPENKCHPPPPSWKERKKKKASCHLHNTAIGQAISDNSLGDRFGGGNIRRPRAESRITLTSEVGGSGERFMTCSHIKGGQREGKVTASNY